MGDPDDWPLTWAEQKTKYQLVFRAKKIYPTPKYKIQKIADNLENDNFSIKVLFLPVSHTELNPIEMVWALLKRAFASKNVSFMLTEVQQLTRRRLQFLTAAQFAKFYEHAKKEEDKYRCMSFEDSL